MARRRRSLLTVIIGSTVLLALLLALNVVHTSTHESAPVSLSAQLLDADPTVHAQCVCPQAPACPEAEQRCLEYLSNFSNVVRLQPMRSNARFGRTAKMRVLYKDPCVQGVAKLPQVLFPLEPYAEYAAFELDRLMLFGRIPPTTWLFLPFAAIESAAANFSNGQHAHEYAAWIGQDVLAFAMRHRLVVADPLSGRLVLGCSVQLRLRNVRPPFMTSLHLDDNYALLLRGGSVARLVLNMTSLTQKDLDQQLSYVSRLVTSFRQRQFQDATQSDLAKLAQQSQPTRAEAASKAHLLDALGEDHASRLRHLSDVLSYLSDTAVFDALIGNDDRSALKNSHLVRVALPQNPECNNTLGNKLIWLDQGKSFYKAKLPPSLDVPLLPRTALCTFRHRTRQSLSQLRRGGGLLRKLEAILPGPIFKTIGAKRLGWVAERASQLLDHMDACVGALGGEKNVYVWA